MPQKSARRAKLRGARRLLCDRGMAKASLSCRWPVVFRADPTDPSPQQERQGSQNLAQELPGPRVLCLFEKRRRRAVLDDDAAVGEVDVVGDLAGEAHLVGDQDAGHALLAELADGEDRKSG